MKRAAPLLALVAAACAATPTPDRAELAEALLDKDGTRLDDTALAHIACQPLADEPVEVMCRWRQIEGRRWRSWKGTLARSGEHWRLIDPPTRRP